MAVDGNNRGKSSLFRFAYHPREDWLQTVYQNIKTEPWGKDHYILSKYIKVNFEIAQRQNKVYEDTENGVAYWRPGFLTNDVADPVWMKYTKNRRPETTYWYFSGVVSGESPAPGIHVDDYQVSYDIPEFNYNWKLYFDQQSLDHIFDDPENLYRLKVIFGDELSQNKHLIFRVLFGEISLLQKDILVVPQWYHGNFHYLVPLFLTQPNYMELAATLTPNAEMRRYEISTLLLPGHAYNCVRHVVRSRRTLPEWLQLSEEIIDRDSKITVGFYNQTLRYEEDEDDE